MDGGISVLVVDDHPVFADALRARLAAERDIRPVEVAYSTVEAQAVLRSRTFDVAIVDYLLRDGTGAALAGRIRDSTPSTAVVMLTASESLDAVVDALAVGVRAWLHKSTDTAFLVRVLHRVLDGEMWLDPGLLARVVPRLLDMALNPHHDALAVLTDREREVLTCLAEAMGRGDIARHLGISENTVRTHIQNVLSKLDVHSSVEAVSVLLRNRSRTI